MKNVTYLERLRKLQLERLDVRRLRADLVLVYKIVFGLINRIELANMFTLVDKPHDTRGHNYKLLATRSRKDIRKHFFSQRIIKVWNNLPITTNFASLTTFKNTLSNELISNYCVSIV